MPACLTCPSCATTLAVTESLIGQRVRCRNCQATVRVQQTELGYLDLLLVRRLDENSKDRRARMKADREAMIAPSRRFKRRLFLVWLTFVVAGSLVGVYVDEFAFFIVAMLGVYLPFLLWQQRTELDAGKPMRGIGLMRRQRMRGQDRLVE